MGKITARPSASGSIREQQGFSLLEVAILAVLLLVAIGGLSGAVLSSLRLSRSSEESTQADEATRALAARMQTSAFADLFRLYDANPANDPVGTAPGMHFDVRGLTPRSDDADGRVGRIVFPIVDVGGGAQSLRENVEDARLGMANGGRDLNSDAFVDGADHSGDYTILPARLIVEWTGAGGDRSYELDLLLVP
ncbi:MAG: hypothetical protein EXS08_05820 [Planctomycetes bacterium]|nr:hypothetical protein [Planctomycetota bacterium]